MDLALCEECPVSAYFLEFRWANYLRDEVEIENIYDMPLRRQADALQDHLEAAMEAASEIAATDSGLPGWNHGLIQPKWVTFDEDGCEE